MDQLRKIIYVWPRMLKSLAKLSNILGLTYNKSWNFSKICELKPSFESQIKGCWGSRVISRMELA